MRHGYESLDAIVHAIPIRDWEGASGQCRIRWPFSGINPTSGRAGLKGEDDLDRLGQPRRDLGHLTWVQSCLSPHTYGSYWLFSSPQNPNFFTDYIEHAVYAACALREHPRFPELAKWVEQVVREDMFHSVTLPGGAGNECPGYMLYANSHGHREMAEACRRYLGFDPTTWPRWRAAGSFIVHTSQPWGGGLRGKHPGGDTHGAGQPHDDIRDTVREVFGIEEDVTGFRTEELPNFGVIFRNRCGTEEETYLAFKSGPARGHYHGDQLSIHYCHNAKPCVVDHHCSYAVRAGQEHMHNRVAFFTDQMPFGNMDGFERVIAFKTTERIGAAIGQVESRRLRNRTPLPPEKWHEEYPQVPFGGELKYRRTIVHVAAEPRDYFVIRDQFQSPAPVGAAFCLHAWDNETLAFASQRVIAAGGVALEAEAMRLTEASPQAMKAASGGKVVVFDSAKSAGETSVKLGAGTYQLVVFVHATDPRHDSLFVRVGEGPEHRVYPNIVRQITACVVDAPLEIPAPGEYSVRLRPDETGVAVDRILFAPVQNGKEGGGEAVRESNIFRDAAWNFEELGVKPGWVVTIDRESYEVTGVAGDGLTLDRPVPKGSKLGPDPHPHGAYRGPSDFKLDYYVYKPLFEREGGRFKLNRLTVFCAKPRDFRFRFFPWCHQYSGQEATQGLRFEVKDRAGEFITVLYPGDKAPAIAAVEGGVKVGEDVITFAGGIDDNDGVAYVTARAAGASFDLTGKDIDMDRFQGDIGLFVPDAGYPFGEIPKWLIRQRLKAPDWAPDWAKQARGRPQ
jgi:hypothetical protein